MNRPGHSNPKVEARTQELETRLGIGKNSSPEYKKLTPLMWLYTLEVVVEGWVPNKTAYAKEYDCARQSLYGFDGHPKVVAAVKELSYLKNSVRIHNVEELVFKQAEEGCVRSQKLLMDRYPHDADNGPASQPDTSPTWDMSLGKTKEKQAVVPPVDDAEPAEH